MTILAHWLLKLAEWALEAKLLGLARWLLNLEGWFLQADAVSFALLNLLAATMVVLGLGVVYHLWWLKKRRPIIQQRITLAELSPLWTEHGQPVIPIADLAPLWRSEPPTDLKEAEGTWRHPRIAQVMAKFSGSPWFNDTPRQLAICRQLLQVLDEEGDCPSVVNFVSDADVTWEENSYRLLAKVTLLDHTLNVAAEVVTLLSADEAWHVIPDTMIAALAHDLGKLPSRHDHLYAMGEHPLASCQILEALPGFEELTHREEIIRAVKLHHKRLEGLLGKTLQKADGLARRHELGIAAEEVAKVQAIATPIAGEAGSKPVTAVVTPSPLPPKVPVIQSSPSDSTEPPAAPEEESPPESLTLMAIPWFEATSFIAALKPYINKMFGTRFLAFSMPDGHVYFQTKVLEEQARKQAKLANCHEIAALPPMDPQMRQVLFTIVHQLRVEHDVIARGLIQDGYFGGYFEVNLKIGRTLRGYYTPFHAEPFGSLAELEQLKSATLHNIIRVVPYCGSRLPAGGRGDE